LESDNHGQKNISELEQKSATSKMKPLQQTALIVLVVYLTLQIVSADLESDVVQLLQRMKQVEKKGN